MKNGMEIGKRIMKLRKDQNLTQHELAAKVGISVSYLRKIEEGKFAKLPAKTLSRIAVALDINVDELVR